MDPGIKISILSELRIANGFALGGARTLCLQVLQIALKRWSQEEAKP